MTETTRKDAAKDRRVGGALIASRKADKQDPILEQVRKGEFTKQQISDPFANWSVRGTTAFSLIAPQFNLMTLIRLTLESSVLKQCIEAMVTNICGHGSTLEYVGPEGEQNSEAAEKEAKAIEAFLKQPNEEYSIDELRKRVRWDMESTGNGYMEVARDKKGRVVSVWHVPSHLMRLTEVDRTPVLTKIKMPRFDGMDTERPVMRCFRRFVQRRGTETVYFKEFGDPRSIDPATGLEDPSLPLEKSATEIIHRSLYHPGSLYGVPRWINNVVAINGARQAELTNLDFFSDNAVPALLVTVAGGSVTQQSLLSLEDHITAIRGRRAMNRVVVLEAYGDEEFADQNGKVPPPKVEVKSLSDERPQDGLFLEYDKEQTNKVRSSFRLPPLFLGRSDDYNRATAQSAYEVAEGQVFGPERVGDDDTLNRAILGTYDLKFWEFRSNPPRITDPKEMLDALAAFDAVGAMTPNVAIGLANEMFDLKIEEVTEGWGDFPFAVVAELAKQGKVKGWETIIEEVDEALEVLPGAAPVAAPANDPNAPPVKPKEPKAAAKLNEESATIVRRALMDLRSAMLAPESKNEEIARHTRKRRRV